MAAGSDIVLHVRLLPPQTEPFLRLDLRIMRDASAVPSVLDAPDPHLTLSRLVLELCGGGLDLEPTGVQARFPLVDAEA